MLTVPGSPSLLPSYSTSLFSFFFFFCDPTLRRLAFPGCVGSTVYQIEGIETQSLLVCDIYPPAAVIIAVELAVTLVPRPVASRRNRLDSPPTSFEARTHPSHGTTTDQKLIPCRIS